MRQIKGYEGLYSITEDGRVWNHLKNFFLKTNTQHGRLTVVLKRISSQYIDRLVAQAFIPNPMNKLYIRHKNGNKLDNNIKNLMWTNYDAQSKHWDIKNTHPGSKLSWYDVNEIRKNHVNRKRGDKTWEKYGITNGQYYRIINFKSWKKNETS